MDERTLIMGDVLHVLKHGFVLNDPEPASRAGLYKYAMDGVTPNSGNRVVRLILIPAEERDEIKLITVMWADEPRYSS